MVRRDQPERPELLISRLKPVEGKRILDIGSGPGVLAIPLAEAGARVTAVDPSSAMLKILREQAAVRRSPAGARLAAVVPVGRPAGRPRRSKRLPLVEVLDWR